MRRIHLRFWQWFSHATYGSGQFQVNVYDDVADSWSGWTKLGGISGSSGGVWTPVDFDLTSYAGKKIKIGFYHIGGQYAGVGWYIDDIQITKKVPEFTGDFESGWGDWYTDQGIWEIGTPTAGPAECYEGIQCAGTVLGGNYPIYNESRLIGAPIRLPDVTGDEEIYLRFWQWFSYATYGSGQFQVNIYDDVADSWSGWTKLGEISGSSGGVWTPVDFDLTSYAGKKIKIGFYHIGGQYAGVGWYIDDIEIIIDGCTDVDGDGYAVEGGRCGPIDCDDDDKFTYPGAKELCDGIDNNCDEIEDDVCIDIILNGTEFTTGDTITVQARAFNDDTPDDVEVKIAVMLPDGGMMPFPKIPSHHVHHIPANADGIIVLGEHTFENINPVGTYYIGGRLLEVIFGDHLSTDLEPFTLNPPPVTPQKQRVRRGRKK